MKAHFDLLRIDKFIATIAIAIFAICMPGAVVIGTPRVQAQKRDMYAALAETPEKARERKNPFAGDPDAVAAGGKLFAQHCAECHGAKAGGTRHGVSLLHEEVRQATPGTLFWILTNGVVRRGMPVWSKLPEPERWQIVTFIESLKMESKSSFSQNETRQSPTP